MASRNLTEIYILMRNNANQNRNMFSEQNITDRMALVESGEGMELIKSNIPPTWISVLEEAQYLMPRIQKKLNDLASLQRSHLLKPTFDDSTDQEQGIDILTAEISKMFNVAQRLIHQIKNQSDDCKSAQEFRLSENVVASVAGSLQDLSVKFRTMQSSYLNDLKSRDERSNQFFSNGDGLLTDIESDFTPKLNPNFYEEEINVDRQFELGNRYSQAEQQLLLMQEDTARIAQERSEEVNRIVNSIAELNHVFKDLSHMVADQGTVLDRIDYNIEQTQSQVRHAYQQLRRADHYQRRNRKMQCILILAPTTLILLLLLIAVKF